MAIAALALVIGLAAAGPTHAQTPTTTTTTTALADPDLIYIQGSGAPCKDPMPARLLIGWPNDVPPPNIETVTIDSGTVATADGTTTLIFSPSEVLDPGDARAQIDSSEFLLPDMPVTQPTYEIVYTVTYTDETTETYTYARDIGFAVPAVGCPVQRPPTTEVNPTTVPDGRGNPAPGATAIPSSPSYTG